MVQKNLIEVLRTKEDEAPTVIEIFCPSRFQDVADECGIPKESLTSAMAGTGLSVSAGNDPDLLIVSPPCGPLSRLQACAPMAKRRNPEQFLQEVKEAKAMIAWRCKLAYKQRARGRRALFESRVVSNKWHLETAMCDQDDRGLGDDGHGRAGMCRGAS